MKTLMFGLLLTASAFAQSAKISDGAVRSALAKAETASSRISGSLSLTYFPMTVLVPVTTSETVSAPLPPISVKSTGIIVKSADQRVTAFHICLSVKNVDYCRSVDADNSHAAQVLFLNVPYNEITRVYVGQRVEITADEIIP